MKADPRHSADPQIANVLAGQTMSVRSVTGKVQASPGHRETWSPERTRASERARASAAFVLMRTLHILRCLKRLRAPS